MFDAEATWHVRKELEYLLREMYWIEEKVDGQRRDRSMWDFYQLYYRDFGQLLVNMENRGIFVCIVTNDSFSYKSVINRLKMHFHILSSVD